MTIKEDRDTFKPHGDEIKIVDTLAYEGVLCEILGYHSDVAKVSTLLKYYVVSFRLLF
jgi:hypothetical protein